MLRSLIRHIGLHPRRLLHAGPDWMRFRHDREAFRSMPGADALPWGRELPMLGEWRDASGMPGAYFFQDRVVAQWILESKPERHIDVGSRIDGFIGHLSVFRRVEVLDIRPQPIAIPGVNFHQVDLTKLLDDPWIECTDSLSCLHTIEHFGLGRYGDAIDPRGHLDGLQQIMRLLKPGGLMYLSTPIGRERVEFNAHRVFAPSTVLSWFADGWQIERTAVICDALQTKESPDEAILRNAGCDNGVGIICARKPAV